MNNTSRGHILSERNISFDHDSDKHRYTIKVDGENAGHADYALVREGVRDFHHTVVDPEFQGQGLSSPLIKYALDDTAEEGMTIVPSCSAVARFLSKNPDYQSLQS